MPGMQVCFGSSLGVAAHVCLFIRGEWHMHTLSLLLAHMALFGGILALEWNIDGFAPALFLTSAKSCGFFVSAYLGGLFASMSIYRLLFHRLGKFPGPRLAAMTKFWHVWHAKDSRNFRLIEELHEKYGDFVRIGELSNSSRPRSLAFSNTTSIVGPRDIAVRHPDAHLILEGPRTRCRKSDFFDIMLPDQSLVFTRPKAMHDARRKIWSRALSIRAISEYQPRIMAQIQVLMDALSTHAQNQEIVLMNDLLYWFTFDSMGEFAFNKSFGMMQSSRWHEAITMFRRALSLLGPFAHMIWIVKAAFALIPWFWKVGDWFRMLAFCNQCLAERMKAQPSEKDVASFFIEEAKASGSSQMTNSWLRGDAATVVVAGSDTTAPTLTYTFYLLAAHPEHAEKIHKELVRNKVDVCDANALADLRHLNGCINESMRLFPVATSTITRDSPPEGVTIGHIYIPGHVKVYATRWSISRDERAFESATDFIPERWYKWPEMVKNHNAFAPFGVGRASCVGQDLARVQLRLIIAGAVARFRMSFADDDTETAVIRDMRDQLTAKPGPLRMKFRPRTD